MDGLRLRTTAPYETAARKNWRHGVAALTLTPMVLSGCGGSRDATSAAGAAANAPTAVDAAPATPREEGEPQLVTVTATSVEAAPPTDEVAAAPAQTVSVTEVAVKPTDETTDVDTEQNTPEAASKQEDFAPEALSKLTRLN